MSFGRIAIFLPSLRGGGAERVMVTLANAFAEPVFDEVKNLSFWT
jgi:hypothetical protein